MDCVYGLIRCVKWKTFNEVSSMSNWLNSSALRSSVSHLHFATRYIYIYMYTYAPFAIHHILEKFFNEKKNREKPTKQNLWAIQIVFFFYFFGKMLKRLDWNRLKLLWLYLYIYYDDIVVPYRPKNIFISCMNIWA